MKRLWFVLAQLFLLTGVGSNAHAETAFGSNKCYYVYTNGARSEKFKCYILDSGNIHYRSMAIWEDPSRRNLIYAYKNYSDFQSGNSFIGSRYLNGLSDPVKDGYETCAVLLSQNKICSDMRDAQLIPGVYPPLPSGLH